MAGIRFPGTDTNTQRSRIRVHTVLDGIFHYRLQGQRRHAKPGMRRIVFNEKAVFKLYLLNGQVGAGVLQFIRKGDGILTGNRRKVLTQVRREIQGDLLGLFGILCAKVIDAHHGIEYKVRPHLQHHDAGALMGNFPLLSHILFNLVAQDNTKHRKHGETQAEDNEQGNIDNRMDKRSNRHRQQVNQERDIVFIRQSIPPADHACQVEKHNCSKGSHKQRMPGTADKLVIRGNVIQEGRTLGNSQQDEVYTPQTDY